MAKKFEAGEMSLEELAAQLRKPEGEAGQEVGEQMNSGNRQICLNTYLSLAPQDGEHILEIGMGNGYFVRDLLKQAQDLHYTGADFSALMVKQSKQNNEEAVKSGQVRFVEASIASLPFEEGSFDAICTTNTLYFWPDPLENARELHRVLKAGGRVLIAYRDKQCLDQIQLTEHGFAKYTQAQCEDLLIRSGFSEVQTTAIAEDDLDFDGKVLKTTGMFSSGFKR